MKQAKYMGLALTLLLGIVCNVAMVTAKAVDVPSEYVVLNRMVGETRTSEWVESMSSVDMKDKPRGNRIIGHINKSEIVERIDCIAYTNPSAHPVKILKSYRAFNTLTSENDGVQIPAGEYLYLLMYTGEGTYLGWYNGKQVWWINGWSIKNLPEFERNPGRAVFGVYEGSAKSINCELWLYMRKSDGTTGWIDSRNFESNITVKRNINGKWKVMTLEESSRYQ